MSLTDLSDADRLAILEDPAHPDHERLIDELDGHVDDGMGPTEDAPYGYMIDEATQEKRPKKRPGRQAKPRAAAPAAAPAAPAAPPALGAVPDMAPEETGEIPVTEERVPLERGADRAPQQPRRGRGRGKGVVVALPAAPKEPKPAIPFRAGPIAKGMNKGYRRIGKIVRVANPTLGEAFISVTQKIDEDDVTVGEAWEELARTNPRIRSVLMHVVGGMGWAGLFMAHMPILVAVLMLDPVASRIPLGPLLLALAEKDDEEEGEAGGDGQDAAAGFPSFPLGGVFAGMSQADMAQALAFAQQMGDQIGQRAAGGMRRGGETG